MANSPTFFPVSKVWPTERFDFPKSDISSVPKTIYNIFHANWERFSATGWFTSSFFIQISILLLITAWATSVTQLRILGPKAPLVGGGPWYLPRVCANWRFFRSSKSILDEGFARYKNEPFWFARNDADMIVLPNKHVEEIRMLPIEVASPKEAHVHNLLGWLTKMDIIMGSDLHFRIIQNKITPMLANLADPMQDELSYSLEHDFPRCEGDDWLTFRPYHSILSIVARISARVFVGVPVCRDNRWLEISTQFTENVFKSLLILRTLPIWMHRFVYLLLPTIWSNARYIRRAQNLLTPIIEHYSKTMKNGKVPISEPTLLSSMVESATPAESNPNDLAHLEVIVSLASIHTTQMNVVHCLYDLAAHPEYVDMLRQEIIDVAAQPGGWSKSSYSKLRKLDSFIKESQRFSPPSMLSYHRVMRARHTLSDGTLLPKDAHICMPVSHIQRENTPNADVFDGCRYERKRQEPGHAHLHQFATTAGNSLNFGHGKYACPGRFFAALEIKTVLTRLIMEYDFMFPPEQGRPNNLHAYEFIFPNPSGELMMKKRKDDGVGLLLHRSAANKSNEEEEMRAASRADEEQTD